MTKIDEILKKQKEKIESRYRDRQKEKEGIIPPNGFLTKA